MWKLTGFLEKYQMAKNDMPTTLTYILRYDKEKGKRVKLKDCEILTQFLFNKNECFLVKKGKFYAVCISSNEELVLLTKTVENGRTPGEIVADFRKGYLKHGITQDKIDLFIENPVEYCKKYKK